MINECGGLELGREGAVLGCGGAVPIFNPAYSLDRAAAAHPQRVSLWYAERSWSVAEAAAVTRQLAELLVASGVKAGDRVAIVARNSPYHLLLHVACARIGAVFVPISYRFTGPELERVLGRIEPAVIIADPETAASGFLAPSLPTAHRAIMNHGVNHGGRPPNSPPSSEGEAKGAPEAEPTAAPTAAQLFFVIDDDAQAALPSQISPEPGILESALAAGWQGLGGALAERAQQDEAQTSGQTTHESKPSAQLSETKTGVDITTRGGRTFAELGLGAPYPEGLGAILLTSGSAGEPKFVPLTHQQLWWGSQNFREGFEYSTWDVELVAAPLSHIGGFNGTTLDLFAHGGTVVVVREFRPSIVLRELERRRVAMMFAVPTMYAAMAAHPDFARRDLSAFSRPLTGGSAAYPELLRQLQAAGLQVLHVFGMTETAAAGCYLPAEQLPTRAGSIGRPFAHVQARVVDPATGEAVELGESGELWLRGPGVAAEYWNAPEHTAASFITIEQGDSCWLRTGDLVRLDAGGYLWPVGRLDEMIITGGENVAPAEVEAVLASHPAVADVAVAGMPDSRWGQRVVAAVTLRSGAGAPSLDELRNFAASQLADYKLPRALAVTDQLPLNSNGKLDRAALARLLFHSL